MQKKIPHIELPIALQTAKITVRSISNTLLQWFKILLSAIYSLYVLFVVCSTGFIVWFLLFLFPRNIGSRLAKIWAKTVFLLGGCPIEIHGKKNIESNVPTIYLANHMSYADAVLLMIALPIQAFFIGEARLLKVPFVANYLRQLKFIAIDIEDFEHSEKVMNSMKSSLETGYSLVIFPEGEFGYPGEMRPFKLGAFKLSAETNIPICPIKITGTDTLWPAHQYLLRPCRLSLTIGKHLKPMGNTHEEINHLRTKTRTHLK